MWGSIDGKDEEREDYQFSVLRDISLCQSAVTLIISMEGDEIWQGGEDC